MGLAEFLVSEENYANALECFSSSFEAQSFLATEKRAVSGQKSFKMWTLVKDAPLIAEFVTDRLYLISLVFQCFHSKLDSRLHQLHRRLSICLGGQALLSSSSKRTDFGLQFYIIFLTVITYHSRLYLASLSQGKVVLGSVPSPNCREHCSKHHHHHSHLMSGS